MTSPTNISISKWTLFEKVGFRFSFIYFLLYIIIQNNGAYPLFGVLMNYPNKLLEKFIPWLGNNVLNMTKTIPVDPNGSGDTTYDYIIVFVTFFIAIVGSLIWSLIDKNRVNYTKLYYWLTVALRFYVGLMLINYGMVKVIKLQFPSPGFYRLIQSYGDSSPMGLAWTFLGFSKGYNLFMGIAEVLAVLLLFRRTLTLGLIITLMTTVNVMAVNYFYDVPVKLLSTHLVVMTLFLLLRDFKTLYKFFLTSQLVTLKLIQQPILEGDKSIQLISKIIKGLLLAYIVIFGYFQLSKSQKQYGEKAPRPEVYGLFEVTHFERNGIKMSSNQENYKRWQYIMMERKGSIQIQKMDKSRVYFKSEIDTLKKEIKLSKYQDPTDTFILKYTKNEFVFSFETVYENDSISGHCKILDKDDFQLMNRGFNWINEYPFNR